MAKKKKKKKNTRTANKPLDAKAEVQAIRQLLENGIDKSALARAKDLLKAAPGDEAETLLKEAYIARITGLREKGLLRESVELIAIAAKRFPELREQLDVEKLVVEARAGSLDQLLERLAANPEPPVRRGLEEVLFSDLTDPRLIAENEALPPEHPLRLAARAVSRAFEAVTTRPVSDEEVLLPEVSRRSVLAPWKTLVQAIAALYRKDKERCAELLESIPEKSAPARLVPAIHCIMANEKPGMDLIRPARNLVRKASDRQATLRSELAKLNHAMEINDPSAGVTALQSIGELCRNLPEEKRNLIGNRLLFFFRSYGINMNLTRQALPFSLAKTTTYFLYSSLHYRSVNDPWAAVLFFDRYRIHAIAEGIITAGTASEAAIYLYMDELLSKFSDLKNKDEEETIREDHDFTLPKLYKGEPKEIRAAGKPEEGIGDHVFDRGALLRRASEIDPSPRVFLRRIQWLEQNDGAVKEKESVLREWADAFPEDADPLLLAAGWAHERGALGKAMGFLGEAEQRDGLNPEVRRARWILLLNMALKHLEQGKPHLARKDLDQVQELVREGSPAILLAALRCLTAFLETDEAEEKTWRERLIELLGDKEEAAVFLHALSLQAKLGTSPLKVGKETPDVSIATGMGHLLAAATEGKIGITAPSAWGDRIKKGMQSPEVNKIPPSMILDIGRWWLNNKGKDVCIAAVHAALRDSNCDVARALFVRGQCELRGHMPTLRGEEIILAACTLARRNNDRKLLGDILDWERSLGLNYDFGGFAFYSESDDLPAEEVERIVREVKAEHCRPKKEQGKPQSQPAGVHEARAQDFLDTLFEGEESPVDE